MKKITLPQSFASSDAILALGHYYSGNKGTSLLYSGGALDSAERSILFLFPYEAVAVKGHLIIHTPPSGYTKSWQVDCPWNTLKQIVGCQGVEDYPEWVGYLGYEMGVTSNTSQQLPYHPGSEPDAYFQRCAAVLVSDHAHGIATAYVDPDKSGEAAVLAETSGWLAALQNATFSPAQPSDLVVTQPLEPMEEYCSKVVQAQKMITDGDLYQLNLSQQCIIKGEVDAYSLFGHLATLNPAPFSAYLNLSELDLQVVSSSPERLLRKRDAVLETRPIKGTVVRGRTEGEDLANKEKLLGSEKDRAELLMITDLMRNDLSKVCAAGSVVVDELIRCEAYTNVYHLLSIIHGETTAATHPLDAIKACFPGGSISGCPKMEAMKAIGSLEKRRRGLYTGSIGYFCNNGDCDFNIAIRTLTVDKDKITVQLGGAIVSDSNPMTEYEETLHKGASIFEALGINDAVSLR